VLLALANQLNVLPADLNRMLIIVVVLSMALTPLLTEVGKQLADRIGAQDADGESC
jgi:Kef-type K+ transport system membrane component KefB